MDPERFERLTSQWQVDVAPKRPEGVKPPKGAAALWRRESKKHLDRCFLVDPERFERLTSQWQVDVAPKRSEGVKPPKRAAALWRRESKKHLDRCFLVDPERFELSTFSMPLRRAPNCAMGPKLIVSCLPISAPNSPEGDYVRYGPKKYEISYFAPAPCVQRRGTRWTWRDSNPRPPQCD